MRWSIPVVALLLAGSVFAPPATGAAGPQWRDWDRGFQEARATGRPVLVDVYTDWCGWCRRMDADVYARPEIRDYLARRFVTVRLDAEGSGSARHEGRTFTSRSLAARFGVSGYPTTLFLKPGGEPLVSVPGYVPADRFLLVLRFIAEGHLERGVDFQEFVRKASSESARR